MNVRPTFDGDFDVCILLSAPRAHVFVSCVFVSAGSTGEQEKQ